MRVLLKISWEALMWERDHWIDPHFLRNLALDIKEIHDRNIEIWIVLWAGNLFRWVAWASNWMDRTSADYMWMIATIMNWIAMQDALQSIWEKVILMSALDIPEVWERYIQREAVRYLEKWKIVIFVAGTWNPYFTTDTAGVLRALEIKADMMIKATKVDWVYDKDPKKFDDAKLISKASFDEVIKNDIRVMDQTWIALARDWKMMLKVASLYKKQAILRAILWEDEWTTII